ncbi:MAG: sarcosine oxidase subunit delta [Alphaproteobacteria bacterium]|nr:sarcosine oxidase subunit delta [Alphaproteobacteria bacterium]
MLLINCPWCGPRDDAEFHYGGEAHILRPANPSALSDEEFAEYLFLQQNPRGLHLERWCHSDGCRRWFNMVRDTATNRILEVYPMGELPSSQSGLAAWRNNWRRNSAAERNARNRVE